MNGFVRRPFDLPQRTHTPPEVFARRNWHRREFLKSLGIAGVGGLLLPTAGCSPAPDPETISKAGKSTDVVAAFSPRFPAPPNPAFEYGRPETDKSDAARFTNFYEFSSSKATYRYVDAFQPAPWSVEIDGLCNRPARLDLDDLFALAPLEERACRHRCVETWAMCVPWTGYPLQRLLEHVDPQPAARFVRFRTFLDPAVAPNQKDSSFVWPYDEGLTIDEARNDLAFLALGVYGEPLPKQHGAPVRLVVPWKYGFKSGKSIVQVTLMSERPATFWNTAIPHEYGFEANVDPDVPHPRWSQRREYMLGSKERYDTVKFNGYGDWVGALYAG
ncbi:MAG: protein-methionine-sulfoxide reductase catalytic subunit MsrP [Planctomyces sp.]|nr:protein-methionine-sulfoxide reductase catalytic subunit MsrP [Planctomyces sp.]